MCCCHSNSGGSISTNPFNEDGFTMQHGGELNAQPNPKCAAVPPVMMTYTHKQHENNHTHTHAAGDIKQL